jgi:thiol-disulfide isomerase/thioredoxin
VLWQSTIAIVLNGLSYSGQPVILKYKTQTMNSLLRNKNFLLLICLIAGTGLGFFYAFTRSFQQVLLSLGLELLLSFGAGVLLSGQKRIYIIVFIFGLMIFPPIGFFLRPEIWPVWSGDVFFILTGFFAGLFIKKYKLAAAVAFMLLAGGVFLQSFILLPSFYMHKTKQLEEKNNGKSFYDILPATAVLQTADGKTYNLRSLKGKVILYDIWFVGCTPCKQKEPSLAAIAKKYAGNKDVQVVCINTGDANSFRRFKDYILDNNLLSLYDEAGRFSGALGAAGMPQEYLVDKNGVIISSFSGFSSDMPYLYKKRTIEQIDALLKQ